MPPLVALVPSPLLGPAVWQPVARLLRRPARVLTPAGEAPEQVLAGLVAQLPEGQDLVLVLHSNAGLYAGALAARRQVLAVVFVDAGIPHADLPTPTAPAAFLQRLEALVDADGHLPPWTQWWSEEDVAPLFPDATSRAAVEAEQPRLSLAYFRAQVPAAPGWAEVLACGYLAFGDTYAEEVERARAAGWPVRRLDGRHLHLLVDPMAVAEQVDRLVDQLLG